MRAAWTIALASTLAAACGGDDKPTIPPSSDYAQKCASPRTGIDPITGLTYVDQPGTLDDEKQWVRSWIDEYYLWYSEVPDLAASDYATPVDYFDVLKTPNSTPTGAPKDRFHFVYDTATWESLSTSDVEAGYGIAFDVIAPRPPREVAVAYTEPGSAGAAAIARGAQVIMVDGTAVTDGDPNVLNAGLFPAATGETHTFEVLDIGATTPRVITLVSADVTSAPVQNVETVDGGAVGYLQFNAHVSSAEAELMAAISQLAADHVQDLVLDMRYNGGGSLAIASELAYMIAGPASQGHTFDAIEFNDKYPDTNPIEGGPNTPAPFYDTTNFAPTATPLPYLGLTRVFVLTGPSTCSASEAVMNGLAGIGVQVIQIGETTCGKPYGFYPADNCGTTYFAIQFHGVNDKGFGDYADGFSTDGSTSAHLPGCAVADDLTRALGDPAEARLAAALEYRDTGICPPASKAPRALTDGHVARGPSPESRLYRLR
jgi:hypothetical protein